MSAVAQSSYTPEEYLALERKAEYKSEYLGGKIFALAGASLAHNIITSNITRLLGNSLVGKPCLAVSSDMRVKVEVASLYTYPDVVVACEPYLFEGGQSDTLLNPSVIIEVLSPSTEA
jgi:Uma2 family endonuclease